MSHGHDLETVPPTVTASYLDELCVSNLLDGSQEVIYFKDLQSRFLRVSLGCAALHRTTPDQMVGLSDFDLFDRSHAEKAFADEQRIIATGEPLLHGAELERWHDRPDSWVSSSKFPLRAPDGTVVGTFGISRDITRLVQAEQETARMAREAHDANAELSRVEAQLRAVLNGSSDAIATYDCELRYRYLNPAGERSRGMSLAELVGRTDRETGMVAESLEVWEPALRRVLESAEPDELEFAVPGPNGEEAWFHTMVSPDRDADGSVVGVLTSTRDITEIKRAERQLAHQALHDSVTGLANRYLLADRLAQALVRMERYPARLALFFVDLDHFKEVNDGYGHDVGDRVLVDVARRLEQVARREDTVARLGGDEFVILCDRLTDEADVEEMAGRVVRALAEPIAVASTTLRVSGSVGAVVTDDPRSRPADLLRCADSAMYRAKQGGRNRFLVFDPDQDEVVAVGAALENELRRALERDQFRLVYQPLLSLTDQRLLGFEALLRWEHPERGLLGPGEFLAAAEERGLMGPIGAWVLDTACRQLAEWSAGRGADQNPLSLAVNVSAGQLRDPDFAGQVRAVLERHGVEPRRLSLEVTERALVQEGADARHSLEALAAVGVGLAVDNFGATYTSLARLPQFPVTVVKLEQLTQVPGQRGIAAAVIAMAHGLGMSVVGEGIETEAQLNELQTLACDDGQGFLLGRPLAEAQVERLLALDRDRDLTGAVPSPRTSGETRRLARDRSAVRLPAGPED